MTPFHMSIIMPLIFTFMKNGHMVGEERLNLFRSGEGLVKLFAPTLE